MTLTELLHKRLIIITGKGGVGKTTISVLLALLSAKQKQKTLIVEMNSTDRVAPLFGLDHIEHREVALAPYLSGINLSPAVCFKEYVIRQIRFKSLYNIIFNNAFVLNFINAVPGLTQILLLGKIYDLERQKNNTSLTLPDFDTIIVDAPATGHGLSALEVPGIIKEAVKVGPMHSHAVQILNLLCDREICALSVVTLAEEMPVNETTEFLANLTGKIPMALGPVFINAVVPELSKIAPKKALPEELKIYQDYYHLNQQRALLNHRYVRVLNERLPHLNKMIVPFQFQGLQDQGSFQTLEMELEKYA